MKALNKIRYAFLVVYADGPGDISWMQLGRSFC